MKPSRRAAGVAVLVVALVVAVVAVVIGAQGEPEAKRTDQPTGEPTADTPAVEGALASVWETALPTGAPTVVRATGTVVVLAGEEYLTGLDRASGEELWRHAVARWCAVSGVASSGVIALATGAPVREGKDPKPCRKVTAYDVHDGTELWSSPVLAVPVSPDIDALSVGDTALTVLGRCSVTRLRLSDGRALSRDRFEQDEQGDCIDSDYASDGQVIVDFVPDDPHAADDSGTLRVRDADTGAVQLEQHRGAPVVLSVLSGSPLVLGLWDDGEGTAQRITARGGRALLAGATLDPVRRAPGSTYAVAGGAVHRFDTTTGALAWSRALQGTVVAADAAGLTVIGRPGGQGPYDVVRMAEEDGQRQLLGRIAPADLDGVGDTDGTVVGDADVLVASRTSGQGQVATLFELPPAGGHISLLDDGRGSAAVGPDDAIGACDGFSNRTLALLGGQRTKVGTRLGCHWYTVSTFDLNIQFETDVAIGGPVWAEQQASQLHWSESLDDFVDVKESVPLPGWGDQAWVLEQLGPRRDHPRHPAPTDRNVIHGVVVRQGTVAVMVLASVEVEKEGAQGVVPAARVRRAVERAVTEIFASLGVEVTRP